MLQWYGVKISHGQQKSDLKTCRVIRFVATDMEIILDRRPHLVIWMENHLGDIPTYEGDIFFTDDGGIVIRDRPGAQKSACPLSKDELAMLIAEFLK